MYDASELFKAIFPLDSKIYQVQTIVKKKYTDDYGNKQEKYLATTLMTRDTYNKINWQGFESSKLDKITEVNFYEASFYKGLTELQELSDRLRSGGSGVMMPSELGGMSFCSEFQQECQQTGDCQGLKDMQGMGLC